VNFFYLELFFKTSSFYPITKLPSLKRILFSDGEALLSLKYRPILLSVLEFNENINSSPDFSCSVLSLDEKTPRYEPESLKINSKDP
jgi:hypothetical protein